VDWERLGDWSDLHRFVGRLVAVRRDAGVFGRPEPWGADVSFFGATGPADAEPWSRSLGWHLHPAGVAEWAVIANAWWEPLEFALPGDGWRRVVDTSLPAPDDIVEPGQEVPVPGASYRLGPRSSIVLTRAPAAAERFVG
jgi:glycogen operon protein